MGEARVKLATTQRQLQLFEKQLLKDIHALERMLEEGWFEIDVTRIGAEQEFCLVDNNWKPSPSAMKMLDQLDKRLYTHELALFNMELNITPLVFEGSCLSQMEEEINQLMKGATEAANKLDIKLVLAGILPTIRKYDLGKLNITPMERYYHLCDAIAKLRGREYELSISGIDELNVKHDSAMLEAANTGFQVHLQVKPDEFARLYNISQVITAPVLAAATFSPLLFNKRLWHESRVALFQQSVDTRQVSDHLREVPPRVTFGNDWLKRSILEIYKEDIMRYRVLLSSEGTENVVKKLDSGQVPELMALKVHNGTVYRWNRPCYGISKDKAHLRIENRVLPSGPTVVDEMANAAFWLGLMKGMSDSVEDVTQLMGFEDAKANFMLAARNSLDVTFNWFHDKKVDARRLILDDLLPVAEEGLASVDIDKSDINKYLGIINDRVKANMPGSRWMLRSYSRLIKEKFTSQEEVVSAITAKCHDYQQGNVPVHQWAEAELNDLLSWKPESLLVEECMSTDMVTVREDDDLQLVAEMMNWKKVRYVPVEDESGKLVGLITSRLLLKTYTDKVHNNETKKKSVRDVMIKDPVRIDLEDTRKKGPPTILDAMSIMEDNEYGSLPVVKNGKLVGIVTEHNYLQISIRLLKRLSKK